MFRLQRKHVNDARNFCSPCLEFNLINLKVVVELNQNILQSDRNNPLIPVVFLKITERGITIFGFRRNVKYSPNIPSPTISGWETLFPTTSLYIFHLAYRFTGSITFFEIRTSAVNNREKCSLNDETLITNGTKRKAFHVQWTEERRSFQSAVILKP